MTAAPSPRLRGELIVAFLVLALCGAALFGAQVAGGGFYWDDWLNAASVHLSDGLGDALGYAADRPVFGYRPVLTVLLVLEHSALGLDMAPHLAMAALFGVITAWSLYLLLRTVGLRRLDSGVPALLLLAFPWTDSTRMWATASYDTLAVALYLLGATLAVRALRLVGGRRRVLLVAGSLALYLAAAWTYEITAVAAFLSVGLYLAVAPRREALRRFALDAAVVALALALVLSGTTRTPESLSAQVDHAGVIAGQAFSLLARALVPVGDTPGWVGAALLVLIGGGAVLAWRRAGERAADLGRWLAAAALGALGVVAGYALFVPAPPHYEPLGPGTVNRMNVLAAVGYAVLAYALARLLATAAPARWRAAVAVGLCAAIGAGWVVKVADDQRGWQRSADVQAEILDAVRAAVPDPAAGTTIYTFGAPSYVAPGVPAFSLQFDLRSAVRMRYEDESLEAYPIRGGDVIECGADRLQPHGGTYGSQQAAAYGSAVFVEVPRRRAIAIDSRADCLRWRARLGAA